MKKYILVIKGLTWETNYAGRNQIIITAIEAGYITSHIAKTILGANTFLKFHINLSTFFFYL